MLCKDTTLLVLERVYLFDIFRYRLLGRAWNDRFKAKEVLGEKLVARTVNSALKHSLKTRDYELFEILLVRYLQNCSNIYRYVLKWNDEKAIQLLHKHKAPNIKMALLRFGTKAQIQKWLLLDIDDYSKMQIINHVIKDWKLNVLDYILTTPLRTVVLENHSVCVWLTIATALVSKNPHVLKKTLDIFEAHDIPLRTTNKPFFMHTNNILRYIFEQQFARITYRI